jgi:hypothetical protein
MKIGFKQVQALFNVEWSLPLLPVNDDRLRDSEGTCFVVAGTTPLGIVTLQGPTAPVGWLDPVKEDWIVKTFEHRLADLWASVESLDFDISGATVPNEFGPSSLSGNLVLWGRPVSFLPQESIGSVHVLVNPVPGVHVDFSGADLRGKMFDRCDLTLDLGKGRISVVEHSIEIDTKGVKTILWAGDFQRAVCEATQMAYAVLEDKQLIIEQRLGRPSGG